MPKQYITLVDALSEKGAELLKRDLEDECVRGEITHTQYLHLKQEQILVFEYRGLANRKQEAANGSVSS